MNRSTSHLMTNSPIRAVYQATTYMYHVSLHFGIDRWILAELVGRLSTKLMNHMTAKLTICLTAMLVGCLTAKPVNRLTTKLVNRLTPKLVNCLTAKHVDRLTAKLVGIEFEYFRECGFYVIWWKKNHEIQDAR